ncbi:homoserine dehydrogenase [Niallia sp. NCCP-28]|uniref:homoserine dehydrogenase n=1 Tax=Niallia sp. NCCP-28 TaxID=2934712 RepID=UPI00208501B9|nr:homoserine dehydrogenase [Niallia sp. NCCP-28]GKU83633.1 homoserine dehydrogenase [Niallia sp. NCCP-28]
MKRDYAERNAMITGYGIVAKELIKLLSEKQKLLIDTYKTSFKVTAIVGSRGMVYEKAGIDLLKLLEYGTGSTALIQYAEEKGLSLQPPIFREDMLIECSPTDVETGGAALGYIKNALYANMNIVSVSKGALVCSMPELLKIAKEKACKIKYSGATAAALPTLDIGEFSLAGCKIMKIEGILNGTSNFILTKMSEENKSFEGALQIAQERGIAETNPSLDIEGIDSACKILLLANGLLGSQLTLEDIAIQGITEVTKRDIQHAKINGNDIKLIASADFANGNVRVEVKPEIIKSDNPLIEVKGTNKGVLFYTEEMGRICCTGGASHPRGAAAAALKDMINLYR